MSIKITPSKYQLFIAEQKVIIRTREVNKKWLDQKSARAIMQEIGELWTLEKERIKLEKLVFFDCKEIGEL